MPQDLNHTFEIILPRYIQLIQKSYKTQYGNARDKDFIIKHLNELTQFIINKNYKAQQDVIDAFRGQYKKGENMIKIFNLLGELFGGLEGVHGTVNNYEKKETHPLYMSEKDKASKKLVLNQRKLAKVLITDCAYTEIQKRLPTLFDDNLKGIESQKTLYTVNWTGAKGNKNEFVQLIYSLHKAGLLNNGAGEITKIVEGLAEVFSVELGAHWQSNLSASIHKAKIGSSPEIFSKIKTAYEIYAKDLEEHNRKTK